MKQLASATHTANLHPKVKIPEFDMRNALISVFLLSCTKHQKLNLVSSCMTIIMTMAGVNCDAKVLDNEITCRIPKNMTIPSEGLPVKVTPSEGGRVTERTDS